jgi:phosphoribosylanthranilate isomerase
VTKVKICGISDVQHALAAAQAGADFIGLVFARSTRQVSVDTALQITKEIARLIPRPQIAGVFVNALVEEVNRTADLIGLDRVQLSGDETWQYCSRVKRPVIKAVHISAHTGKKEILDHIDEGYRIMGRQRLVCLLDTKAREAYGGTGISFDWALAKEVAAKFPVIVAGGLNADNVKKLVGDVRPWGVDVSSGVETGGRKDAGRIAAFIRAVREIELPAGQGHREEDYIG